MKKITYPCLFLISLFLFISCVNDDTTPDVSENEIYGKITFSFNALEIQNESSDESNNITPTSILISISNENNELVFENETYSLTNINGSYLTNNIKLPIGNYTITDFNVINSDNEVILSTPLIDSEFANILNTTLPITFSATVDNTTNIILEVLRENTENNYEDFYVSLIKQSGLEQVFIEGTIQILYGDESFNTTIELLQEVNHIRIPVTQEFINLNLIVNTLDEERSIAYSFGEAILTTTTNPFEIIFLEPYDLIVNTTNEGTDERNLEIIQTPGKKIKVKVDFTANDNISRLYVTKNTFGSNSGPVPYQIIKEFDLNLDGSSDIANNEGKFIEIFDFDSPNELNETVEYKIWVTTGKGDFRDASKKNSIGDFAYGTIRIKGSETAPSTNTLDMKYFSNISLYAPLTDATSNTFFSLYDNQVYAVNQEQESISFLDFGYFYGNSSGPSFYSVYDYPKVFGFNPNGQHISEYIGVDLEELNHYYFAISTMNFDSISRSSDLDVISHPANEGVQNLQEGNVIEFADNYGNKGLIKVTKISGGFNLDGHITFDLKVQMNPEPIRL